jgi:O-antigen biosynthesis protein
MTTSVVSMKFPSCNAPYYIYAPPYDRKSAGVKVLYMLCDMLNRRGERAYIVSTNPSCVAPDDMKAPLLSSAAVQYHKQGGFEPIVVYPEIVTGNPFRAKRVVRYLLYYAGAYGGPRKYDESDSIFSYSSVIREDYGRGGLLTIPVSDPKIFRPPDKKNPSVRQGTCFYSHKHRLFGGSLQDITRDSTEITKENPASPRELAELFRRCETFYAYEDTALIAEAMLCGCKVVRLDGKSGFPEFATYEEYFQTARSLPYLLTKFITETQS